MAEWVRRPFCGVGDELLARIRLGAGGGFPLLVHGNEPHWPKYCGAVTPERRP